jgi:hypothetical protein
MDTTQERVAFGHIRVVREIKFGAAARHNRGRYAGSKVHKLSVERVVGVIDEAEAMKNPRSFGALFLKEQRKPEADRKPIYTHVSPVCGCTQGQFAGQIIDGLACSDVTCTRCK